MRTQAGAERTPWLCLQMQPLHVGGIIKQPQAHIPKHKDHLRRPLNTEEDTEYQMETPVLQHQNAASADKMYFHNDSGSVCIWSVSFVLTRRCMLNEPLPQLPVPGALMGGGHPSADIKCSRQVGRFIQH